MISQTAHPVQLSDPNKLVLSPHVYGHGTQDYMYASNFPDNMPTVWDAHFGHVPDATGTPIVVGEWGGVWEDTEWPIASSHQPRSGNGSCATTWRKIASGSSTGP